MSILGLPRMNFNKSDVFVKNNAASQRINLEKSPQRDRFTRTTNLNTNNQSAVSFGSGRAIKLACEEVSRIPVKKFENIFQEGLKEIRTAKTLDEKIDICRNEIFPNFNEEYHKWCAKFTKGKTQEEIKMLGDDLPHEYNNPIFEFYHKLDRTDNLSSSFEEDYKHAYTCVIETCKRYQLFLKNGLSNNDHGLAQVFGLINKSIQRKAEKKNVAIKLVGEDLLKNPDILPQMEEYKLYTVLYNLMQNAVKYTPKDGEIVIKFSLDTTPKDFSVLKVNVRDNGIGIPPEKISKVLQGERADNAKEFANGTGYGLPRVKKILDSSKNAVAKKYGLKAKDVDAGEIIIKSPLNPGTAFPGTEITVQIPVETGKKLTAKAAATSAVSPSLAAISASLIP